MFTNAQVLPIKKKNDTVLGYSGSLIYNFLLKCENLLASHAGIVISLLHTYFYLNLRCRTLSSVLPTLCNIHSINVSSSAADFNTSTAEGIIHWRK